MRSDDSQASEIADEAARRIVGGSGSVRRRGREVEVGLHEK